MITLEDLNEQVQSLTKSGHFQTAANVIADWAYWDMVGRYDEPPDVPEPVKEYRQDDREAGGSMLGQLQDRLDEEFGEDGWRA